MFWSRPIDSLHQAEPLHDTSSQLSLTLDDGQHVQVVLRPHPRARRMTLHHDARTGGFRLSHPPHISRAAIERFLTRHIQWMSDVRDRAPERTEVTSGATVPIHGVPHTLLASGDLRGRVQVMDQDENGPVMLIPGEAAGFARRVRDYLKAELRDALENHIAEDSKQLGVRVTKLRLSDPRGRWGSCSSRGTLSFSWRLAMAPPFVQRYLVAHEMAHLREMNHSSRFWQIVASLDPKWGQAERWLKRHGAELMRYDFEPGGDRNGA